MDLEDSQKELVDDYKELPQSKEVLITTRSRSPSTAKSSPKSQPPKAKSQLVLDNTSELLLRLSIDDAKSQKDKLQSSANEPSQLLDDATILLRKLDITNEQSLCDTEELFGSTLLSQDEKILSTQYVEKTELSRDVGNNELPLNVGNNELLLTVEKTASPQAVINTTSIPNVENTELLLVENTSSLQMW
ncbi:hypothetical protein RFI_39232 [Reticulomyxa filosa]|uniref:Uncharacterized protein n=1 Tax=Reticulomyxa filosa TaxID=46433 RepID=X6L9R9_RETFI|nr:hypothetical protein RFI_39232 [Reticulomyxa filosa]|eukprot:ETN98278.1 hypothetical protein RFI_39232 [Reticulomyxa filosa]